MCHRRCLCAKLEIAAGKSVVGGLVLKKNNLAVGLPPSLKTYGDLAHSARTGLGITCIYTTRTARTADTETAFTNSWENSIAIG